MAEEKRGRRSKVHEWLTEDALLKIQFWASRGLNNEQIQHNMGVGHTAFNKWKREHPEIQEALDTGRRLAIVEVENAMYKEALGYYKENEKTREVLVEQPDGSQKKELLREKDRVWHRPVPTLQIYITKCRGEGFWNDRVMSAIEREAIELSNILKQIEIDEKKGLTSQSLEDSGLKAQLDKLVETIRKREGS